MTGPKDIHDYLAEFEDIPGTRVFTAARARQGYHLNQFAMSLMKPENRERWKADEAAYLDEWPLTDEQKEAVLARDYNALLDLGGNIYFLVQGLLDRRPELRPGGQHDDRHVGRGLSGDDDRGRPLARGHALDRRRSS